MHYFEFAQKDATVYEASATQSANTGLDEILEIRKDMNEAGTVVNVSRVLIKFDLRINLKWYTTKRSFVINLIFIFNPYMIINMPTKKINALPLYRMT